MDLDLDPVQLTSWCVQAWWADSTLSTKRKANDTKIRNSKNYDFSYQSLRTLCASSKHGREAFIPTMRWLISSSNAYLFLVFTMCVLQKWQSLLWIQFRSTTVCIVDIILSTFIYYCRISHMTNKTGGSFLIQFRYISSCYGVAQKMSLCQNHRTRFTGYLLGNSYFTLQSQTCLYAN